MVSLGQNLKMAKRCEKLFYKSIKVVLCKKAEKWDDFGSRPSCKGCSPCKGCSLCKMVSLGQKLKMPKTCENWFYKNNRVVLWKKSARKNTKYSRNETILKIGHLAKAVARPKTIAFAKWWVWVKNLKCQKDAKNDSTRTLELFCAKNRSKKHQIFRKWHDFDNPPSYKGYSPCQGYSLCKMVSLSEKLKMPKRCEKLYYKSIKVVLWKKPLDFKNWPSCKGCSPNTKYSEKSDDLGQNWPSCKGCSPCKDYSLCKMVSLGKIKNAKNMRKIFYKN